MYIRELMIAIKDDNKCGLPSIIVGYANISHMPIKILQKAFKVDVAKDRFLWKTYFLSKSNYLKYKKYFKLGLTFNFELFEYSISLGGNANIKDYFLHSSEIGL